jgi:dihydroflavonol-4-reductase
MKAFLTGSTGFIGGRVAQALGRRGDQVVALVRSPDKAAGLEAELVPGDLGDRDAIRRGLEGCDACFHVAAVYEVGVPKSQRPAMYEANVRGTENVLDAAIEAGVPRIVHVSTVNAFGNTRGEVVDETYARDEADGFVSYYDETKYRSHQLALERIAAGAPIVIVQPGGVYGPGDHSLVGDIIEQASTGKLRAKAFPEMGMNLAHVDDIADGILLAHDRGELGRSYVLGGELTRMGELIDRVAALSQRKPPRMTLPPLLAKASAPLGPIVGPALGFPPNLSEAIRAAHNVTYWAKDDRARAELGYAPRDLDTGLRQTLAGAAG